MSDPTYRIDVRHEPHDKAWPWKGSVVRLSDEHHICSSVSESKERLVRELAELVALQNVTEPPFSVLVDDDGRPVEGHSVKA